MSDTILAGDLTVYYLAENRQKRIVWSGGALKTNVQKMITVYDATEDLFTQPTQQDDGLIFSAETPGEYTIGKIDAGDQEPWFIDLETMEHIIGDYLNFTGCALKTSGWTRVEGTNTGIIVVPISSGGTITKADVGFDISTDTDGDVGTLLDFVDTGGATDYLWIRPDSNAAANSFDNSPTAGDGLTCNAKTATQSAASITGEMVWGNVFTQGALQPDTHIYIFQNGTKITSNDATAEDWWPDGHVDRAIPIKDWKTSAFPTIDLGYLSIFARQYTTKYTYSIIRMNTTSGGNVAAGLSSGNDITNTTGYKSITFTAASGNWSVGDEMTGDTSNARSIITQIDNPGATQTVHYYLIGDPLTDFSSGVENLTNEDDTGTGTKNGSAPASQGPALTSWFDGAAVPTYAFGNTQVDIDDDGTPEEYGITIDLNQASLSQMHQYNKYAQRRGSTLDHDGLDGEEWIGIDYAVNYATITGTVAEGATVTGVTSGATSIVVSNPGGSSNTALLRNTRGTYVDGEQIQVDGSNYFAASGLTVSVIVPVAESSFGTLAGTTFFFSRGVVPIDYKSSEENLFSVIDATGTPKARPTSISMTIFNLKQFDWASCFRLTGTAQPINKTEFSATGGEAVGDPTLTVDGTVPADVPGKTLGGSLVLVDVSDNNKEYVIRYDSYVAATGVFTLSNIVVASADAGTDTDTIVEAGAFGSAKVGDIVVNHTRSEAVSYVTEVTDANTVQIFPAITGQTTADSIELNCVPITLVDTADAIYVPIVFTFKTADGSASASMQYVGDFFALVRVRNTSAAATKIKGYTAEVPINSGGGQATATRIQNTVYGS